VNRPAPELTVAKWLSNPLVSIEDMKGKTVVVHFWTLNHNYHVRQIRLLNILQEVYRDKGLVCVAICPAEAEIETIKRHIAEQSLSYSIGLDQPTAVVGAEGETFHQYAVGWGHQFVLINTAGEITGGAWEHDLEAQIQILLAD
jgi:peroxiredoxin